MTTSNPNFYCNNSDFKDDLALGKVIILSQTDMALTHWTAFESFCPIRFTTVKPIVTVGRENVTIRDLQLGSVQRYLNPKIKCLGKYSFSHAPKHTIGNCSSRYVQIRCH